MELGNFRDFLGNEIGGFWEIFGNGIGGFWGVFGNELEGFLGLELEDLGEFGEFLGMKFWEFLGNGWIFFLFFKFLEKVLKFLGNGIGDFLEKFEKLN